LEYRTTQLLIEVLMSTKELYIEPMTVGMVLDRSFRLYRENFALMIGLTAMIQLPVLILTVGVPLLQQVNVLLGVLAALVGGLAALITLLVLGPWVTAASTKAVSERYLGNEITAVVALKFGSRYLVQLLLIQLVIGLIIGGIVLLGIIPGMVLLVFAPVVGIVVMALVLIPVIVLTLSYLLVAPVAVLEKLSSGTEIRRRSWDLVTGHRWRVFAVVAVITVAQLLFSFSGTFFVQMVYGSVSGTGQAIGGIISGIAGLLTAPLQPIAVTLIYYDLRIRKEGFDLEMLSQAISSSESS
jgi:hypothetical protein